MQTEELSFYLALHFTSGIGSRRMLSLMQYFSSAERAFAAPVSEIMNVPGFGKETASTFAESRNAALKDANSQLQKLSEHVQIVTYFDPEYPVDLKKIYAPPPLLFVYGNVNLLSAERMIAIVGSRKTSDYGRQSAREFAEAFAGQRITVVSGFAKGIDTVAHQATYEAGGKTIAVLGSGVDVIYPSSNTRFSEELVASGRGTIISELPMGTKPDARNFPWRNRIVSGLSRATVVVESEVSGGSMITATLALDENRDVFGVPGDISRPSSAGPNQLIRESRARLASNAAQVLEDLGWSSSQSSSVARRSVDRTSLTIFETRIVDVLEAAGGPLHIDSLAERAGLDVQDILVQLLTLEFKSIVRQMAGKQFVLMT